MKRAWKSGFLTESLAVFVTYIGFWMMLGLLGGNWIWFAFGLAEVVLGTILFIVSEHLLGIAKSEMTKRSSSEQGLTESNYFVGSRNSKVYHRLSCPHTRKILSERRISYKDSTDAKAHGRKPCARAQTRLSLHIRVQPQTMASVTISFQTTRDPE